MKITKKTRLLAKPKPRVRIGGISATYSEDVGADINLTGLENTEAVKGYSPENYRFNCKLSINGGPLQEDYFLSTDFIEATQAFGTGRLTSGDTVKVVLEVDPAKTEFDQTPAEATVVIP